MKMESLKSTESLIHKYEDRDHYYYNKFKYRAKFTIQGIRSSIYCDDKTALPEKFVRPRSKHLKDYSETDLEPILNWIDWRNTYKPSKQIFYRIEANNVSVFSNDLSLLETLKCLGEDIYVEFTEARNILTYVGTKTFVREPKHKFRIHLKSMKVDENILNNLRSMLAVNKSLFPSQAFKEWLTVIPRANHWRHKYTSASHFVDYDDENILSYLLLLHGNIFGKKYKLEKRQ